MSPLRSDPRDRHARFIAAFCEDLASAEYRRAGTTPRAAAAAGAGRIDGDATPRTNVISESRPML